jgi:hypothetical protein
MVRVRGRVKVRVIKLFSMILRKPNIKSNPDPNTSINPNTNPNTNRPAELVYKINVPLVTKASLMVLDVSERCLMFSYLEDYKLSIPLPYPVFDKKGVAKYDKVGLGLWLGLRLEYTDA